MAKVLVTPRSLTKGGDPALELLKKAGYEVVFCTPGKSPDEAELGRLLPGCVGWLAGVEKIGDAVLAKATELKAISRNGTGVDLTVYRSTGSGISFADLTGPLTTLTRAPRTHAASTRAAPIFPVDLLVMNLTGSISSQVGPDVMSMLMPARSCSLRSILTSAIILSGSGSLPEPSHPQASSPETGSRTCMPLALMVSRFSWVALFCSMFTFMDGQTSTGALVARTVQDRRS